MMESSAVSERTAGRTAPIFVVGPPRAGTTLTANILGRHSRVFMAGENHFFEDIYTRRDDLGDFADPAARRRTVERLSTIYGRHNQQVDQQRVDRLFVDRELVAVTMQPKNFNCLANDPCLARRHNTTKPFMVRRTEPFGDQRRQGFAYHLALLIAEHTPGSRIPRRDQPTRIGCHDRISSRADNRIQRA